MRLGSLYEDDGQRGALQSSVMVYIAGCEASRRRGEREVDDYDAGAQDQGVRPRPGDGDGAGGHQTISHQWERRLCQRCQAGLLGLRASSTEFLPTSMNGFVKSLRPSSRTGAPCCPSKSA